MPSGLSSHRSDGDQFVHGQGDAQVFLLVEVLREVLRGVRQPRSQDDRLSEAFVSAQTRVMGRNRREQAKCELVRKHDFSPIVR